MNAVLRVAREVSPEMEIIATLEMGTWSLDVSVRFRDLVRERLASRPRHRARHHHSLVHVRRRRRAHGSSDAAGVSRSDLLADRER